MRVLHVISCLVKADGHSQFCLTLAERLTAQGMEHRVFTMPPLDGDALLDTRRLIHYASGRSMRVLNVCVQQGLEKQLTAIMRSFKPDVVHLHGGWHPVLFFGARVARRSGVPIVLSLHGSLRPAVIEGDRRLKKRLAWWVYQRRLVKMADTIHVSTEAERTDVARLGFDKPVVVIPNGVDIASLGIPPDSNRFYEKWPDCRGQHAALFLSRIHPLKGLDLLVAAWARVTADFPAWHLLIAGPDEQGTRKSILEQVKRLEVEDRVTVIGPLYGADKAMVMNGVDLFVLPTRSENFGIVVAEALACGVPVITTKGAPWAELENCESALMRECRNEKCVNALMRECLNEGEENQARWSEAETILTQSKSEAVITQSGNNAITPARAGWWVDIGVEPLAAALKEAMSLTDEERHAMGENGRRLVEAKYRWDAVAERMLAMYEKCVNALLP